jgi:hypothetical protein
MYITDPSRKNDLDSSFFKNRVECRFAPYVIGRVKIVFFHCPKPSKVIDKSHRQKSSTKVIDNRHRQKSSTITFSGNKINWYKIWCLIIYLHIGNCLKLKSTFLCLFLRRFKHSTLIHMYLGESEFTHYHTLRQGNKKFVKVPQG